MICWIEGENHKGGGFPVYGALAEERKAPRSLLQPQAFACV
jgi:hypothetical protein